MGIQTNLKSLTPRREAYKREITLVSGGYYAPKSFPDGKVTVYPWDATVDSWFQERMRQPKREHALWEVTSKVANLGGINYMDMPVGDILTILMVARSILSECVVDYTAVCPQCNRQNPDKVGIPNGLIAVGKKPSDYKGTDAITLPDSKDVVELRVMSVGDEIRISERSQDEKNELPDSIANILFSVATVGGGRPESKEEAMIWFNALSPKDADYLGKKRVELTPQLESEMKIKCDGCGHMFTHTLDLHRDFFRGN